MFFIFQFAERCLGHELVCLQGGPSLDYYLMFAQLKLLKHQFNLAESSLQEVILIDFQVNSLVHLVLRNIQYITCIFPLSFVELFLAIMCQKIGIIARSKGKLIGCAVNYIFIFCFIHFWFMLYFVLTMQCFVALNVNSGSECMKFFCN